MAKGMNEKQILVIVKEPGKKPRVDPLFDNTLPALQEAVGGPIETVTISPGVVFVCNEEGHLRGMPYNCCLFGVNFVGTVVALGSKGDSFASLKSSAIPGLLRLMDP